MKHKLMLTVVAVLLLQGAFAQQNKKSKGFVLDGNVAVIKSDKVMLIYDAYGKKITDTVPVSNGIFRFRGRVDGPTYAQLWSTDRKFGTWLFLENSPMAVIQKDSASRLLVEGSLAEKDNKLIRNIYHEVEEKNSLIWKEWEKTRKMDSAGAEKRMEDEMEANTLNFKTQLQKFIATHPKSIVSVHELKRLASQITLDELESFYNGLDKSIQQTENGKSIARRIEVSRKTGIGMPAMNFKQKSTTGTEIGLADFKGKYLLIDFWASWCGPCRAENPNLVKSYLRYNNKGFEILGVSLDDKEDKWKEAIQKDQLVWAQVSDLKGWKNEVGIQYDVTAVPANYLVGPDGKIIAKNLRGEELDKKLSEIFQ